MNPLLPELRSKAGLKTRLYLAKKTASTCWKDLPLASYRAPPSRKRFTIRMTSSGSSSLG